MDLTKTYPASVRETLFGVAQLKRAVDKGKALALGTVGEYHYDCPMDKAVFQFLGIDAEQLLAKIKEAVHHGKHDREIYEYLKPIVGKKTPMELEAWNRAWLSRSPEPGSESEQYFLNLRNQIAPERLDITRWADLLDCEEGRLSPTTAPVAV